MQPLSVICIVLMLIALTVGQPHDCGPTKKKCLNVGGQCFNKTHYCDGPRLSGKRYCFHPEECSCCADCAYGLRWPCKAVGGTCMGRHSICYGQEVLDPRFCKWGVKCKCCIQSKPGGCWLGDTEYRNGTILHRGCIDIQCEDGVWIESLVNIETYGQCGVYQGLFVYPYDRHDINNTGITYSYYYQGKGCYVTSQRTYPSSPDVEVGVYSKLVQCTPISPDICVTRLKYNEELFAPPPLIANVDINVMWGSAGIPVVENFGTPVTRFPATVPPVVIFHGPAACILIVGSKGLSVRVCQNGDNLNVYVWAVNSAANQDLCGLCDKYTGGILNYYYKKPCVPTTSVMTFANSWKLTGDLKDYCDRP